MGTLRCNRHGQYHALYRFVGFPKENRVSQRIQHCGFTRAKSLQTHSQTLVCCVRLLGKHRLFSDHLGPLSDFVMAVEAMTHGVRFVLSPFYVSAEILGLASKISEGRTSRLDKANERLKASRASTVGS